MSRRSRPTRWDVKPLTLIPFVQPRRDVMMEMRPGGLSSGLTVHQPIPNEELEREQRQARDRQQEKEKARQIQAGTAEEPIYLPYVQELTPMMPMQLQHLADQTRMEPVDVLIQKSARPEPLLQVMFQQGGRGERRGRGGQFRGRRGG